MSGSIFYWDNYVKVKKRIGLGGEDEIYIEVKVFGRYW